MLMPIKMNRITMCTIIYKSIIWMEWAIGNFNTCKYVNNVWARCPLLWLPLLNAYSIILTYNVGAAVTLRFTIHN